MSRRPPQEFGSWGAADAAFTQFMADLPLHREQLRQMLAATGGPQLDGSVDSLDALNEWYIETALRGEPDGMDWWPVWIRRPRPVDKSIPGAIGDSAPDEIYRLWELMSVYVGDVLLPLIPHSRWVCFRAKNYREVINGQPLIDLGNSDFPGDAIAIGNANVPRMVSYRGTGHRFDVVPSTRMLSEGAVAMVRRFEAGRDAGTLKWQKAPTGPDAHRRTTKPDW
jgi:hypothetical protein